MKKQQSLIGFVIKRKENRWMVVQSLPLGIFAGRRFARLPLTSELDALCAANANSTAIAGIIDSKLHTVRYYQRSASDNSVISPVENPAAAR